MNTLLDIQNEEVIICNRQLCFHSSPLPLSFPRSNWLKPCCGRRVALWQVCLLSAGFNCLLVACVILVVLFLTLELLIDTKLLQCKQISLHHS